MARDGRENADSVLIAALAGGATHADAAATAGVSPRTVRRRLDDPAFKAQVQVTRADLVESAVGILARVTTTAAETLAQLLDKNIAPTVRLGAARAVIELGAKLREQQDLEGRIAALEERQTGQGVRTWAS